MARTKVLSARPPTARFLRDSALLPSWEEEERRSKKCDLNRAPPLSPFPFISTPLPCHLSADRPSESEATVQPPFAEGLAVRKTEERIGGNGGVGQRIVFEIQYEICLDIFCEDFHLIP